MNTSFIRTNLQGFKLNDTLASNLKFSGHVRLWSIDDRQMTRMDGEKITYWIVKDEFGARFSAFDEELVMELCVGERYEVAGEIKIAKGATYLNLKHAIPMNGNDFSSPEGDL